MHSRLVGFLGSCLLIATLMTSCAQAPIANPTGLPAEALNLQYVLDFGCFPFLLGEASEDAAMKGVGLTKVSTFSLVGSSDRHWVGPYAGVSAVRVAPGSCYVHVIGANSQAYRDAVLTVLRRRLGADPGADARPGQYPAWVPGQVTACRKGVRYSYYTDPPSASGAGFDVALQIDPVCP